MLHFSRFGLDKFLTPNAPDGTKRVRVTPAADVSAVGGMQCAGCSLAGAQCAVRAGSWAEPWAERERESKAGVGGRGDVNRTTANGMSVNGTRGVKGCTVEAGSPE